MATSTIRETCKACGLSHVSNVYGAIHAANYAVVIDECVHCRYERERKEAAAEAVAKGGATR